MSPHPLGSAINLPRLSPEEAYVLVDVLELICRSLWDTYGDDMLDLAAVDDAPQRPPEDDLDIPF
jgi:hypothetical protein